MVYQKSPVLLFLHGWGGNANSWAPIIERLKGKFDVHALNLPGFGKEPLMREFGLSDYADFVSSFVKKSEATKFVLVGHSFGGAIAVKIASQNPEFLQGIILVSPSAVREKTPQEKKLFKALLSGSKKLLSLPAVKNLSPLARKILYKSLGLEKSDYYNISPKDEFLRKTFVNIVSEDLSEQSKSIKVPTLIIWGENDTETPPYQSAILQKAIKGSKLTVFKNASHFSYLEEQEKFCEEVTKFIKTRVLCHSGERSESRIRSSILDKPG